MTLQVNIAKAKATLSELVARAEAGEEVVLMRNGKPVATIKATSNGAPSQKGKRQFGLWTHLDLKIPDDLFLTPDVELEDLMDEPIWPKP